MSDTTLTPETKMTKQEIIDFLINSIKFESDKPYLLFMTFRRGYCDKSCLRMTAWHKEQIHAISEGYEKAVKQAQDQANVSYTVAVKFAENEAEFRLNLSKGIDVITNHYLCLMTAEANKYTSALGNILSLVNFDNIL